MISLQRKVFTLEKITADVVQRFLLEHDIELMSSHTRLCLPVIDRIYRKMRNGIRFSGIKVDGNLICDGHHRYVAALLADFELERIPSSRTSATRTTNWNEVVFVEEDWDTPAKIKMLNEEDAYFNNMTLTQLVELLK